MDARYAIGIDLGTTNSVLAFAPLGAESPEIQLLPIPQYVAAGTVESRRSLPSMIFFPPESPTEEGDSALPWASSEPGVVGELARRQSAESPDRTIVAAKSWLGHHRVDRRAPLLPEHAPDDVPRLSPVDASRRVLAHLVAAWEAAHPDAPLVEQVVVVTVPASFDAGARELTREAALAAGLPDDFVLLEEPQSAVYAWLAAQGDNWRKQLKSQDRLLVVDVGGGTTDFSLIGVDEEDGELVLRRIAVGDHLLVGGDNMDLALAHLVSGRFGEKGVQLNPWQSISLWHSCRAAKEVLLQASAPASHTISVLGRGSRMIGGTVSVEVEREPTATFLLDGFFPPCDRSAGPARQRASGFREIGLPYESDAAVTRHLAAFLQAHAPEEVDLPSHVLLNGGVFKSEAFRQRLGDVLAGWYADGQGPRPLDAEADLDHAVARGGAYYAWTKTRGGVRIRGGTARAYYIGIETAGLAIPGMPRPMKALCVAPVGMEEGSETDVPAGEIGLVVGQTAQFRFFCSSTRKDDATGALLDTWGQEELVEIDPVEAQLPVDDDRADGYVPVRFHSRVTELGMLELWCAAIEGEGSWKLEFSVREPE